MALMAGKTQNSNFWLPIIANQRSVGSVHPILEIVGWPVLKRIVPKVRSQNRPSPRKSWKSRQSRKTSQSGAIVGGF